MRKFIAALMAALMLLSLCGCVEQTGDREGEWRPDPDYDGHGLTDWIQSGSTDPNDYWEHYCEK